MLLPHLERARSTYSFRKSLEIPSATTSNLVQIFSLCSLNTPANEFSTSTVPIPDEILKALRRDFRTLTTGLDFVKFVDIKKGILSKRKMFAGFANSYRCLYVFPSFYSRFRSLEIAIFVRLTACFIRARGA